MAQISFLILNSGGEYDIKLLSDRSKYETRIFGYAGSFVGVKLGKREERVRLPSNKYAKVDIVGKGRVIKLYINDEFVISKVHNPNDMFKKMKIVFKRITGHIGKITIEY